MDRLIKDRYNQAILNEAMRRYGIRKNAVHSIDAFESFIYEFKRDSKSYILRIAHSTHRSPSLIQGEVDWINDLADGGLSVARAVPSKNGKFVEAIEDRQNGAFLATAFEKAAGQPPWGLWTPALFETYGELIGRMHALSKKYQPMQPAWKRPEWDDAIFEFVERYLPASEAAAKSKYKKVCDAARRLPKEKDTYGLIHQDAHGNNLFVDQAGQITLFDFDDCAYSWFINEIAIVLFHLVQDAADWPAFTDNFLTHFLKGYVRACPLASTSLEAIPSFLKIREIELYAVLHRDFDGLNIDDPWCARFMHNRKSRIEHDIPFIDFDFAAFPVP